MKTKKNKILITGGAGFIGSEVVRQLIASGYKLRVVDNLSKHKKIEFVSDGIEFVQGDLTDQKFALKVFSGMDKCIHLAAMIGGIAYFHKYPATILSINEQINASVFNAAVKSKIDQIVYISSSMVYESSKYFPLSERILQSTPVPKSAYGFSKLAGEWYCKAFAEEHGLKYSIIRPFNVYGPGELPGNIPGFAHVIPDLTKKILSGQYPLQIFGSGNQSRSFTHVTDVARAIIATIEKKSAINNDFNIASDEEIKIKDLARMIWHICGREEKFKLEHLAGYPYDVKRRSVNILKAEKVLNWTPEVKLKDALPEIVKSLKKDIKLD